MDCPGGPVNTRGSVANSSVAYPSGIMAVDPAADELLFERFLNAARSDLPDIDLACCGSRWDEVLDYLRRTCKDWVAREIAGLSWAQADRLRRGMSHFGRQEMAETEVQFVAGCRRVPASHRGRRGSCGNRGCPFRVRL